MNLKNVVLHERSQMQKATRLYDSIDVKCAEKANLERQKQISGFLGLGTVEMEIDCKLGWGNF